MCRHRSCAACCVLTAACLVLRMASLVVDLPSLIFIFLFEAMPVALPMPVAHASASAASQARGTLEGSRITYCVFRVLISDVQWYRVVQCRVLTCCVSRVACSGLGYIIGQGGSAQNFE